MKATRKLYIARYLMSPMFVKINVHVFVFDFFFLLSLRFLFQLRKCVFSLKMTKMSILNVSRNFDIFWRNVSAFIFENFEIEKNFS